MYHTSAGNCANQIVPGVFLSDLATALDPAELDRLGITHVLSVLDFEPSNLPAYVTHMHVRIEDRFDADLLRHLPATTEFIRSALAERDDAAVLVHCMMGISRSATVVCAYLVAEHGMSARDAITHTKSKRPVVRPNSGFERQLGVWARQFATPVPSGQQQQRDGAGMHLLRERLRRILDASGGAQAGQKRMTTAAVRS